MANKSKKPEDKVSEKMISARQDDHARIERFCKEDGGRSKRSMISILCDVYEEYLKNRDK